jgi:lipoprotein NlpI/transglutaminase-like putative cysteine protease
LGVALARWAAISFLWASATAAAEAVYRDGAFEFAVDTVPSWVKPAPVYSLQDVGKAVPGGVALLVSDQQYRVDPTPAIFRRIVMEPVDASGLQSVSHLQLEYDPAFNHLTIHDVVVVRNGVAASRLDPKTVRLLQRERDLEKAKYDGTVTATLLLEDVQVGDAIEYAYTIEGMNPRWPKAISSALSAGGTVATGFARARIVADARRPIRVRPMATTATMIRTEKDGAQEWLWEQRDVPAIDLVLDAPTSVPQFPTFQFSELAAWRDVVAWGRELFPVSTNLSPDLERRVADWMAREPDPARRTLAALRYVQDDIRYFGIELGTGSLVPRDPNETARSGFGDCKDKSMLLIALLRRMDIDAWPVLAGRRFGALIGDALPSPRLFDHMIVEVRLGAQQYWLDPTISLQGGDLRASSIRSYGYVLPIEPVAAELVKLDLSVGPPGTSERIETFTLAAWDKPASLTVENIYSGWFANVARVIRVQMKQESMDRSELADVQRRYKQAMLVGSVEFVDDRTKNEVRLKSVYTVPGFIEKADNKTGVVIVATGLISVLPKVTSRTRRVPYAQAHPVEERHRTIVNFPADIKTSPPETHRVRDKAFVFDSRLEAAGRRLTYDASWTSQRDSVDAADWADFLAKNDEMRRYMALVYDPAPPERTGFLGRLFGNDKYVHDHREKREAIERLSRDILSGRLTGDSLAEAYRARGIEYSGLSLLDEALFDLNKSLALRPNDATTLADRGVVLTSSRRYDEALRDLNRALELDPLDGRYKKLRGIANFHSGKFEAAATDFRASIEELSAGDRAYSVLWLYLATLRAGRDVSGLAALYAGKLDTSSWPYALVRYYAGALQIEGVLSAAATGDAKTSLFNSCEAYYFIGALGLARGDAAVARQYFEKARGTDVREYIEWVAAGIELERLK